MQILEDLADSMIEMTIELKKERRLYDALEIIVRKHACSMIDTNKKSTSNNNMESKIDNCMVLVDETIPAKVYVKPTSTNAYDHVSKCSLDMLRQIVNFLDLKSVCSMQLTSKYMLNVCENYANQPHIHLYCANKDAVSQGVFKCSGEIRSAIVQTIQESLFLPAKRNVTISDKSSACRFLSKNFKKLTREKQKYLLDTCVVYSCYKAKENSRLIITPRMDMCNIIEIRVRNDIDIYVQFVSCKSRLEKFIKELNILKNNWKCLHIQKIKRPTGIITVYDTSPRNLLFKFNWEIFYLMEKIYQEQIRSWDVLVDITVNNRISLTEAKDSNQALYINNESGKLPTFIQKDKSCKRKRGIYTEGNEELD